MSSTQWHRERTSLSLFLPYLVNINSERLLIIVCRMWSAVLKALRTRRYQSQPDQLSNKEEVENIRGSVTSVSHLTDSVLATNFVFS